jgi:cytoskeletal protein RodZ
VGRNEEGVPRTPEEFGAELQRLRESGGVSLDDIVSETKIGIAVLRNLESGRFAYLPERVFTRNFVRQVGEAIGFEPDVLAEWFDLAWDSHTLRSGSHPAIAMTDPEPPRAFKAWMWGPILLGVIILLGAIVVLGAKVLRGSDQESPRAAAGLPAPTVERHVPSPSPAPSPGPTATTAVGSPTPEGNVRVEVQPGEECWIRTRDAEGRVNQRLLRGGEKVQIPLRGWLQLTLGNGGGVTVRAGDAVYEKLGAPGEVVHLEVRPSGLTRISAAAAPRTGHD